MMNQSLSAYIESLSSETIPDNRKKKLEELASYIKDKHHKSKPAKLIFICTHNSRRSHFCQIWAHTAAEYFKVENLLCYSGGTEATAFHPHAVAAINRAGFTVSKSGANNPLYHVFYEEYSPPINVFSKKYEHEDNPQENFVAIMTCTDADENCPFIAGAELRIFLPYEDPKVSDGTGNEDTVYDERCRQIATEMCYLVSLAKGSEVPLRWG
jgi:arsenate reductase (thioredoxin)